MMSTHPIAVGIDGGPSARFAAIWAATLAARRGLGLRLVYALDVPVGYPPGIVDPGQLRAAMWDQGRSWLQEARDTVLAVVPELAVVTEIAEGPVVPALIAESRGASMLVLGTRGLGGFTGLLVGSISVGVAGRAQCPVVVARGRDEHEPPPLEGPVVVGVDGAPTSEASIAFAFAEAAARDAGLVAVHAWTDTVIDTVLAGGATIWDFAPAKVHAGEVLAERLAGWQEKYPEVTVTREVVHGRPAPALLARAHTAGLVVVGTRGRGGFRSLILGSTGQHLLYHAPCPVAVVRTDGE